MRGDLVALLEALIYRYDDDLMRGELGWQDEAVVVRVRHDERAHQTRRDAPGGSPDELLLTFLRGEGHVEGLSEVLPEEVRGTALQRLAILHQRLDGIGLDRTSEALVGTLDPYVHGHGKEVTGEVCIDVDHADGLFLGLLTGSVRRVPLLPEELRGTEEEARTHLPAHNVRPLIAEDG